MFFFSENNKKVVRSNVPILSKQDRVELGQNDDDQQHDLLAKYRSDLGYLYQFYCFESGKKSMPTGRSLVLKAGSARKCADRLIEILHGTWASDDKSVILPNGNIWYISTRDFKKDTLYNTFKVT